MVNFVDLQGVSYTLGARGSNDTKKEYSVTPVEVRMSYCPLLKMKVLSFNQYLLCIVLLMDIPIGASLLAFKVRSCSLFAVEEAFNMGSVRGRLGCCWGTSCWG